MTDITCTKKEFLKLLQNIKNLSDILTGFKYYTTQTTDSVNQTHIFSIQTSDSETPFLTIQIPKLDGDYDEENLQIKIETNLDNETINDMGFKVIINDIIANFQKTVKKDMKESKEALDIEAANQTHPPLPPLPTRTKQQELDRIISQLTLAFQTQSKAHRLQTEITIGDSAKRKEAAELFKTTADHLKEALRLIKIHKEIPTTLNKKEKLLFLGQLIESLGDAKGKFQKEFNKLRYLMENDSVDINDQLSTLFRKIHDFLPGEQRESLFNIIRIYDTDPSDDKEKNYQTIILAADGDIQALKEEHPDQFSDVVEAEEAEVGVPAATVTTTAQPISAATATPLEASSPSDSGTVSATDSPAATVTATAQPISVATATPLAASSPSDNGTVSATDSPAATVTATAQPISITTATPLAASSPSDNGTVSATDSPGNTHTPTIDIERAAELTPERLAFPAVTIEPEDASSQASTKLSTQDRIPHEHRAETAIPSHQEETNSLLFYRRLEKISRKTRTKEATKFLANIEHHVKKMAKLSALYKQEERERKEENEALNQYLMEHNRKRKNPLQQKKETEEKHYAWEDVTFEKESTTQFKLNHNTDQEQNITCALSNPPPTATPETAPRSDDSPMKLSIKFHTANPDPKTLTRGLETGFDFARHFGKEQYTVKIRNYQHNPRDALRTYIGFKLLGMQKINFDEHTLAAINQNFPNFTTKLNDARILVLKSAIEKSRAGSCDTFLDPIEEMLNTLRLKATITPAGATREHNDAATTPHHP